MSDRLLRVNRLLKQEVSKMVEKEIDPSWGILTITDVETSPDMKEAKIWYSLLNGNEKIIQQELGGKKRYFQKELNKKLKMKFVPRISFEIDKSGKYVSELDEIFGKLK